MNELDILLPIIESHLQELNQAGVLSVRPGYQLKNDWPTD
jgi:hypothetical protein